MKVDHIDQTKESAHVDSVTIRPDVISIQLGKSDFNNLVEKSPTQMKDWVIRIRKKFIKI